MHKDDEIIAAYVRERKPEILDTLSFIIYAAMYRATKAIKSLADSLSKMSSEEIALSLSEMDEMESEGEETDD